jgi:hypothetical protein
LLICTMDDAWVCLVLVNSSSILYFSSCSHSGWSFSRKGGTAAYVLID